MSARSPLKSSQAKRINRTIGKAVRTYNMISDGDKIAVGISGGCDSLTLLWFLKHRLNHLPINYELLCIHVDPGFKPDHSDQLKAYAQTLNIPIQVEHTQFGMIAHGSENRENPCFLCARLRRQRIFEIAEACSCNKVALGHNKDDLIETLMINMFYAGEISCMHPRQSLFQGKLTVIRPLAYTDADAIRRFAKINDLPTFMNPCPSASKSKRSDIRDMLTTFYQKNEKVKGNLFRALHNVKSDYLLTAIDNKTR